MSIVSHRSGDIQSLRQKPSTERNAPRALSIDLDIRLKAKDLPITLDQVVGGTIMALAVLLGWALMR